MYSEPPINPEEDTRQTMTVGQVSLDQGTGRKRSGVVGLLSLLGAFGFTVATAVILLSGSPAPAPDADRVEVASVTLAPSLTPAPTETPGQVIAPTDTAPVENPVSVPQVLPTVSVDDLSAVLAAPIEAVGGSTRAIFVRDTLSPFTVIPDRPRNRILEYVIERGDTVYDIAQKFGLEQESIAWSNDRRALWTLITGDILYIPPVDGVAHVAVGQATIQDIAVYYKVDDAFDLIDSEFNQLKGYTPDMVPPSGMRIFIPGGVGENINWAPPVVQSTSGGGGGPSAPPNTVSFEAGSPGSCGAQPIGPAAYWQRPIASYTVTRGYADWHPGIDLAASPGTPVFAANTGRVIFAGWSRWGYGQAIVISHGPFQTLYGHLSSINVGCGQIVTVGQTIGGVGSTGNSSGPHLHFELMYNGVRGNPAATIGF